MMSTITEIAIIRRAGTPASYVMEAINVDGDGGIAMAEFSGPDAEKLAFEYAVWKYGWKPGG